MAEVTVLSGLGRPQGTRCGDRGWRKRTGGSPQDGGDISRTDAAGSCSRRLQKLGRGSASLALLL